MRKNYNLTREEELKILNNAIDEAFISDKEKEELREILNKKFESVMT